MKKKSQNPRKYGALVSASKRMGKIYTQIGKAAKVDMPVLIVGETGTGKELVARENHNRSNRCEKAFVAINMSAIPAELLASELFGHEKGAFTGAAGMRVGRFQEARGGTLFLDEVITMEDRVQVALLRVLETHKFRRVGGTRDFNTDVRILASVNEDPVKAVKNRQFRVDLLHRLQVIRIQIPPLRVRSLDIPVLVQHFLEYLNASYQNVATSISKEAGKVLSEHSWPGNVRELRNVVYHSAIQAEHGRIEVEHLPPQVQESRRTAQSAFPASATSPTAPLDVPQPVIPANVAQPPWFSEGVFLPVGLSLEEAEKAYVLKTLSMCGNNKTQAAKALGMSRKSLYDKLKRWSLLG